MAECALAMQPAWRAQHAQPCRHTHPSTDMHKRKRTRSAQVAGASAFFMRRSDLDARVPPVASWPTCQPPLLPSHTCDAVRAIADGQRGWPVFETACAALVKGSNKCLDVGRLPMSADCPRAYHPLVKACTAGDARPVPQLPEQFDESSTRLRFTNGHEDGPLTRKLYSAAFFQRLGGAKKLGYSHLGWHDADAQQLARIIRAHVLVNVVALDLRFNRFTAEGVRALAASISTETLPRLQTLALDGNADIGDKGARSIADMIARGAVPRLSNLLSLEGCGLGDAAIQLVAAALTPETTPLLDDVSVRNNHHSSSAQEALERSLCALRASRWRLQMLEA